MFSWLLYFSPKLFGYFCILLLVYFRVLSPDLLVEFSLFILEYPLLSVLFYPFSISSFFGQYFLVYFLKFYCYFFVLMFLFCPNMLQRFSFVLSFLSDFVDFLYVFPVEFPMQVLMFVCVLLGNPDFLTN